MTIERIREAIQLTRHTLEWCNQHPDEVKGQIKCLETILWALKKQIPKKPKLAKVKMEVELNSVNGEADAYESEMSVYLCPSCDELVGDTFNRKKTHCICGQRLDWGI